jgi:hypothetical protein
MGTNIIVAFEVKITVTITDTQIISCTAGGINLDTIELNEENTITANYKKHRKRKNKTFIRNENILTTTRTTNKRTNLQTQHRNNTNKNRNNTKQNNLNLEPGQYWAEITEPVCGAKNTSNIQRTRTRRNKR